jgi:hypothetical protein
MNMKSLRTGIAAAMGGAVLLAGLLVGASLAFAQEGNEPGGSSLERLFDIVEDAARQSSDESGPEANALDEITADLLADIEPLVDQIRDRVLVAVDEAVAADLIAEEDAAALKERIAGFELPDELPLRGHAFGFGERDFRIDGDCFRLRVGPDGAEADGECPEFDLPEGFPFGPKGFEFEGRPFNLFGDRFDGFPEDLDLDLDGLMERLESGMNLDEAFTDLDIDLDQLLADARDEAMAEIDRLVEDGTISEERADSIKKMLEGFDPGAGFPFGFEDFSLEGFDFDSFDFGEFDFDGFDFGEFEFDRFRGPRGHGHGFFGGDGSTGDVDAASAGLDV